jgi:protein SCO1/2
MMTSAARSRLRSGVLGVALWLGACSVTPEPAAEARAATPVGASLFGYPWLWTDEQGHSTAFAQFRGAPLIVTEIYTSCTSTCPRTVSKLRQLSARLLRAGRTAQFLLITLDPASDTPERLRRYKADEALPASWHLLRGSKRATDELTNVLDIHVLDGGSHLVHDAKIVVFDAEGRRTGTLGGSASDDEALLL